MDFKFCNKGIFRTLPLFAAVFFWAASFGYAQNEDDEEIVEVDVQPAEYDANTIVYCDALWFRVHAADCPDLILKDVKKTMTLEEADKAGARIGESGQSGRTNCCLLGYQRKYSEKEIGDDVILSGDDDPRHVKHLAGCHRYWPSRTHMRRTKKDWVKDGFKVCPHCIERGPSLSTVSDEEWQKLGPPSEFVAPDGWVSKPLSPDTLPSRAELEILVRETLANGSSIQELAFEDPLASLEQFITMRFFFPVHQWLDLYMAYRGTGDRRIYGVLLESARHYYQLSVDYPSVAQAKASDPEGLPYMLSMAACARITLQLALKHPSQVTGQEIDEAEAFLKTMVSVLEPTYANTAVIDPEMGIPQAVADDFRTRAFNRSMNGIGTLAMISAALKDLQAIKNTTEYQLTIDYYRKEVWEFIKHWHSCGHFCQFDGENHFYYPYSPRGENREVKNGCVIFNRAEDIGHYSHSAQGMVFLFESTPDLGIDDNFMTAVANSIYHNAHTKIRVNGDRIISGYVECPTMAKEKPTTGGHLNDGGPARDRFYVLQAFRNDMIDGLCNQLSTQKKAEANSQHSKRIATVYGQYVKALRKDRRLIHLGEKM